VGAALKRPAQAFAGWLGKVAGNRNIKAAGGIQSDITRARKQVGRDRLNELGQDMGKEGLVGPTTTPTKTFERANALMDDAGSQMGEMLQAADQTPGAALNNADLINRAAQEVYAPLKQNPHTTVAADKFLKLLGGYADTYGKGDLNPSKLHEIRKNISKDLYGWRGNKDPEADAVKSALHDFRSLVSDELNKSVKRGGQSTPEWLAANRKFEVGARAEEFADKGMDRSHGNNLISPMEALAGMSAMVGGTAVGHPAAGVGAAGATLAAALARRHGSGTLGWAAGGLKRGLQGAENASPEARTAFIQWLESQKPGLRFQLAGAKDEENHK
jgi:hypothetical protein